MITNKKCHFLEGNMALEMKNNTYWDYFKRTILRVSEKPGVSRR